jgi:hypothetical protein
MMTRKKLIKAINALAQTLQTEQRIVDEHRHYVKTYLQNHALLFSGILISAGLIGWLSGRSPHAPRLFKQVGRALWLAIP